MVPDFPDDRTARQYTEVGPVWVSPSRVTVAQPASSPLPER